jgi:hypothetical protein
VKGGGDTQYLVMKLSGIAEQKYRNKGVMTSDYRVESLNKFLKDS